MCTNHQFHRSIHSFLSLRKSVTLGSIEKRWKFRQKSIFQKFSNFQKSRGNYVEWFWRSKIQMEPQPASLRVSKNHQNWSTLAKKSIFWSKLRIFCQNFDLLRKSWKECFRWPKETKTLRKKIWTPLAHFNWALQFFVLIRIWVKGHFGVQNRGSKSKKRTKNFTVFF